MPVPYSLIEVSQTTRKEFDRDHGGQDDAWLEALLTETLEEVFNTDEYQYSFQFDRELD